MEIKTVGVACDHAGYPLKQYVIQYLEEHKYAYKDFGCNSDLSCDYPDYAHPLAEAVESGEIYPGIAICGSGEGMAITLNKHQGVRAGLAWNKDVAELIRGKTGRVFGDQTSLLTTMKAIPLAYDKDMQEDKEPVFDAFDTVTMCVRLMAGMLETMTFREDVMEKSARHGFTNATDAADYLVGKGVPFRDAHGITGRMVLYCIEKGLVLDDLTMEEFKSFSESFDNDIYEAISLKTCVDKRLTTGAPGLAAIEAEIAASEAWLSEEEAANGEDADR